jgi:hypothetical protein
MDKIKPGNLSSTTNHTKSNCRKETQKPQRIEPLAGWQQDAVDRNNQLFLAISHDVLRRHERFLLGFQAGPSLRFAP